MSHVSRKSVFPRQFLLASFVFVPARLGNRVLQRLAGRLGNGGRQLLRRMDDSATGARSSFVHRQPAVACSYKSSVIHLGGAQLVFSSSASARPNKLMEECFTGNRDVRTLDRKAFFLEPTEHSLANIGLKCILLVRSSCVHHSRLYCIQKSFHRFAESQTDRQA
jgi:hypothetical protein